MKRQPEQVRALGGQARVEALDISSAEQWSALVDRLRADWPSLNLLVNNAGIGVQGNIGDCPIDDWRHVIDVNLFGAIYGCHFCRDWLLADSAGAGDQRRVGGGLRQHTGDGPLFGEQDRRGFAV